MRTPLLIASTLVGILVVAVGIYRALKQGEFMPMILGMLILMSCAANYLKRKAKEEEERENSKDDLASN